MQHLECDRSFQNYVPTYEPGRNVSYQIDLRVSAVLKLNSLPHTAAMVHLPNSPVFPIIGPLLTSMCCPILYNTTSLSKNTRDNKLN